MSISGISASPAFQLQTKPQPSAPANTGPQASAPQQTQGSQAPVGYAAQQAARARYLRTGIDKDASLGDPDHDAGGAAKLAQAATRPAPQPTAAGGTAGTTGGHLDLTA